MRIFVLVLLITLVACAEQPEVEKEGMEDITGQHVTELEKTACYAANDAGTCQTKLPSLGFITADECCEKFGKCC